MSPIPFTNSNLENKSIGNGVELATWGRHNNSCDIHISQKENDSILILNGYISDAPGNYNYQDQNNVVDNLRQLIMQEESHWKTESIIKELYGSFSLIFISLKDRVAVSFTDRICSRPIWYHKTKRGFVISSNALAIARITDEKTFSLENLVSYFLYGSQIDLKGSIFSKIYMQPEGSFIQYDYSKDDLSKVSKWYKFKHEPEDSRSLSSWVELVAERSLAAAERILRTTKKPLIFLSGGVDSRLAASAIVRAGGKPTLCTLGDSVNLEVKVAKLVAKALNCQQTVILRDEQWYLRNITKTMFYSNGSFSWIHSHFNKAYETIQESHGVDSAILGDFCEAFSKICFSSETNLRRVWDNDEFVKDFNKLPLPNYQPTNSYKTSKLFHNECLSEAKISLQKSIKDRYFEAKKVSLDPLIIGDYFFRWQMAPCIATFQMFNDVRISGAERNIMFDREMHQLLEILPSSVRQDKNLGSKVISKLSPISSLVPNANSLLPLSMPDALHKLSKKIRPKLGKIKRSLVSNTYHTTASWPHLPKLYLDDSNWKKRIQQQLLDKRLLPGEIFNRSSIEKHLKDFYEGDISLHTDIERLLGFTEVLKALEEEFIELDQDGF